METTALVEVVAILAVDAMALDDFLATAAVAFEACLAEDASARDDFDASLPEFFETLFPCWYSSREVVATCRSETILADSIRARGDVRATCSSVTNVRAIVDPKLNVVSSGPPLPPPNNLVLLPLLLLC